MENMFTAEDVKKLKRFMDLIGANAEMTVKIGPMMESSNLIGYIMRDLIPKIEANILEIKQVVEPSPEELAEAAASAAAEDANGEE